MKDYTLTELLEMTREQLIGATISRFSPKEARSLYSNITTLTEILQLNDADSHKERVALREEYIKQHPNDVHWDYAEYITAKGELLKIDCKVSTGGDYIALSHDGELTMSFNRSQQPSELGPKTLSFKGKCAPLQRIILSTFKSLPEGDFYDELTANHKDGIVSNNALSNLEWTIVAQNARHRNSEYIIGTMMSGKYKGKKFAISRTTMKEFPPIYSPPEGLVVITGCKHSKVKDLVGPFKCTALDGTVFYIPE